MTTDPTAAAATAALRLSLSIQSAQLGGIHARLSGVRALLVPPEDGWHGPAEHAQTVLLSSVLGIADEGIATVKRALDDTQAAIWALA